MTKKVYTVEEVELQGYEKNVKVWPLTIKNFRRVADVLNTISSPKEGEEDRLVVDILLDAAAIAMETYEPDLADVDKLSSYVDMPTLEFILNIATGVKVNDPNLPTATGTDGKT